jgi:Rod binding domain-containing protein
VDSAKLILTETVAPPEMLSSLNKVKNAPEEKKKQFAKDFESLLINKMLDEMKNTVGDWGFEEDAASKQIQGIFNLYMSQHIGQNGGFGLWKQIYEFLSDAKQMTADKIESYGKGI